MRNNMRKIKAYSLRTAANKPRPRYLQAVKKIMLIVLNLSGYNFIAAVKLQYGFARIDGVPPLLAVTAFKSRLFKD